MKLSRRLFPILSAFLLIILILTSCSGQQSNSDPTEAPALESESPAPNQEQEEIAPLDPENIQISTSGEGKQKKVNFSVVRPKGENVGSEVNEAATSILKELSSLLGAAPKLKNDNGAQDDSRNDSYEILVGHTSYTESAEAAANCGYGDYIIDVVGNKIVILAYTAEGVLQAAEDFIEEIKEGYDQTSGVITLKESEFAVIQTLDEQLSDIPLFDGGIFYSYYDAGTRNGEAETQCDEIIISATTPELYDAYLQKVATEGFTKYTDHTMAKNKFATFTSEEYVLTVGFYDYSNEVRVLIEDSSAPLPALKSENVYTKVTDAQITLLGLEYEKNTPDTYASNAMSILIRLEDGRFVVIDGGHNHKKNSANLINTIEEQSKDYTEDPVIAAWIITHAHGDHFGMVHAHYKEFEGIKVERFLFNYIAESERARAMQEFPDNWEENEGGAFGKTYVAANALKAEMHKVHVGQVFYFADLQIEVLFTTESYGPTPCNALNTTSVVMKMTFTNNGKKTVYMSLGDATGNSMELCTNMYGDFLKADIVQTAHHGYSTWGNNAGIMMAYETIDATLVLWPMGLHAYPTYAVKDYNSILFTVPSYKECYVAGSQGDYTIVKLPYVHGESVIELLCDGDCPAAHYYKKED